MFNIGELNWTAADVIIGLLTLLLSLLLPAIGWFFRRQRKSLTCKTLLAKPLVTLNTSGTEHHPNIEIMLDGKIVTGLQQYMLEFINDGNVAILASDFATPLSLVFDGINSIVSKNVAAASDATLLNEVNQGIKVLNTKANYYELCLPPTLLNPRDWLRLFVVIDQHSATSPELRGRIAGIKKIIYTSEDAELYRVMQQLLKFAAIPTLYIPGSYILMKYIFGRSQSAAEFVMILSAIALIIGMKTTQRRLMRKHSRR